MFNKKLDIEMVNKFNSIENKIDIINSKFNSITLLDGCCNCKERELKINQMLIEYFDERFLELDKCLNLETISILKDFKQNIINELQKESCLNKSTIEVLSENLKEFNLNNSVKFNIFEEKINVINQNNIDNLDNFKQDITTQSEYFKQINQDNFKEILENFTVIQNSNEKLLNLFESKITKNTDTVDFLKLSITEIINQINDIFSKYDFTP
jgi:hypothetical protein